jgi:hypothetical protein
MRRSRADESRADDKRGGADDEQQGQDAKPLPA